MLVLLGIGFVAGLITALSPCVLPVLPIVLAGSAAGGPRRPYAIVAGLVVSLHARPCSSPTWFLDLLGLPLDVPRTIPRSRCSFFVAARADLPRVRPARSSGLLRAAHAPGAGTVWRRLCCSAPASACVMVPCAGPVLAAVPSSRRAATVWHRHACCSRLAYALGARSAAARFRPRRPAPGASPRSMRTRSPAARARSRDRAPTALAIVLDRRPATFTTAVPGYTRAVARQHVESQRTGEARTRRAAGARQRTGRASGRRRSHDSGPRPPFSQRVRVAQHAGRPAAHAARRLRGQVVLVNFWTYTCVNCLRELPTCGRGTPRTGATASSSSASTRRSSRSSTRPGNVRRAVSRPRRRATRCRSTTTTAPGTPTRTSTGRPTYLVDQRRPRAVRPLRRGRSAARTEHVIRTLLRAGSPATPRAAVRPDLTPDAAADARDLPRLGGGSPPAYAGSPDRGAERLARIRVPAGARRTTD